MITIYLKEIQQRLKVSEITHQDALVSVLLTDSRMLRVPEETLFFAIRGGNNNGHDYIQWLYGKGVNMFVVDADFVVPNEMPNAQFLVVNDVRVALQEVALMRRERFVGTIIGVTGSNGKTIVKEWLYHLLWPQLRLVRSPKSYNSQVGVPLSLWQLEDNVDAAIIEAGISMPSEMARLQRIIKPQIGIFTNIGQAHQQNFVSLEAKLNEKLVLFKDSDVVICNADCDWFDAIKQAFSKGSLFSWGESDASDLQIVNKEQGSEKTKISFKYDQNLYTFDLPFVDEASVENVMHAVACAACMAVDMDQVAERCETLEPVEMRLEVKEGRNGTVIINDYYNSDFHSLSIALTFVARQAGKHGGNPVVILSDIYQSGMAPERLYAEVARLIQDRNIKQFVGVGKEITQFKHLFADNALFFDSTDALLDALNVDVFVGQVILLKGARVFKFEHISRRFAAQRHLTSLEIKLSLLVNNLNYFRALLPKGTKVVGMVKAFGYGSGSPDIARLLTVYGCDYLGVAVADEGVELREAGIKTPILVMTPEKGSFDVLVNYHLEPAIYAFDELNDLCRYLKRNNVTNYPVHIKIDTGMHRLGFIPEQLPDLIDRINRAEEVSVSSVFSHLAGADDQLLDGFTEQQVQLFKQCCCQLESGIGKTVIKHILNSAGSERFPQHAFDMVRLGIGLYGVSAVNKDVLTQIAALKSSIVQIKDIPLGDTVGYGRRGVFDRAARIAILPIGYGDGLNRKLGNGRGAVLVNQQRAPYVGNICMDLCMIDITGLDVQEGDEVTIFGHGLPIWEVASWLDTIPYEVITSISRRVKRVYVDE